MCAATLHSRCNSSGHDSDSLVLLRTAPVSRLWNIEQRMSRLFPRQIFDIIYLLNSVGAKVVHGAGAAANAHVVLNANTHASEMYRPALVIGDIDTGLDRDAIAMLERGIFGVAWHVVDVDTNVVANVVGKQDAHGIIVGNVEPEVLEAFTELGLDLEM